jgi:hypothetical protein
MKNNVDWFIEAMDKGNICWDCHYPIPDMNLKEWEKNGHRCWCCAMARTEDLRMKHAQEQWIKDRRLG